LVQGSAIFDAGGVENGRRKMCTKQKGVSADAGFITIFVKGCVKIKDWCASQGCSRANMVAPGFSIGPGATINRRLKTLAIVKILLIC
jgi:hypothetical protein